MKLKVIFDKNSLSDKFSCGWGISYLIDGKVLFDTGEKSEYLFNNIDKLGVEIEKIQKVVISHNSWDHRSGLWDLLKVNKNIEVFACLDFFDEFKDKISTYNFKLVKGHCRIIENIYTSGCLQVTYKGRSLYEQFILLKTEKGVSVVCGCSHSGVLEFVNRAKEIFPKDEINSILGGLHLMDKDKRFVNYLGQELKNIGIKKIGPSHCTGFEAADILKKIYSDNFLDLKVGIEIEV